jgi:hypothetical protein
VRRNRRDRPVPDSAWTALVTGLQRPDDLRRLANSAVARLRYCYAERALARLAEEFDDGRAAAELADLLVRQDRFDQAAAVLRRRLATDPQDRLAGSKVAGLQQLWHRVEKVRARGTPGEVADLLADGGVCDSLREEAAAGDVTAAEQLVERLVERGFLREIRRRADQQERFAEEALADLYAAWGEVEELTARAEAGDRAAELRLSKMSRDSARGDPSDQIKALREQVDQGAAEAAVQLCGLLFELRDEENLRAELEAGTAGAAERLIALYTTQDHESLIPLRAFGLDADGDVVIPE